MLEELSEGDNVLDWKIRNSSLAYDRFVQESANSGKEAVLESCGTCFQSIVVSD